MWAARIWVDMKGNSRTKPSRIASYCFSQIIPAGHFISDVHRFDPQIFWSLLDTFKHQPVVAVSGSPVRLSPGYCQRFWSEMKSRFWRRTMLNDTGLQPNSNITSVRYPNPLWRTEQTWLQRKHRPERKHGVIAQPCWVLVFPKRKQNQQLRNVHRTCPNLLMFGWMVAEQNQMELSHNALGPLEGYMRIVHGFTAFCEVQQTIAVRELTSYAQWDQLETLETAILTHELGRRPKWSYHSPPHSIRPYELVSQNMAIICVAILLVAHVYVHA